MREMNVEWDLASAEELSPDRQQKCVTERLRELTVTRSFMLSKSPFAKCMAMGRENDLLAR
jgi:hypothetical protein